MLAELRSCKLIIFATKIIFQFDIYGGFSPVRSHDVLVNINLCSRLWETNQGKDKREVEQMKNYGGSMKSNRYVSSVNSINNNNPVNDQIIIYNIWIWLFCMWDEQREKGGQFVSRDTPVRTGSFNLVQVWYLVLSSSCCCSHFVLLEEVQCLWEEMKNLEKSINHQCFFWWCEFKKLYFLPQLWSSASHQTDSSERHLFRLTDGLRNVC